MGILCRLWGFTHPSSLHKYSYVAGNPINATDPSGYSRLVELKATILIGAVLGAISSYYVSGNPADIFLGGITGGVVGGLGLGVLSTVSAGLIAVGFDAVTANYLANTAGFIYAGHQSLDSYTNAKTSREKQVAITGLALSLAGYGYTATRFNVQTSNQSITTVFNNRPSFDLQLLASQYKATTLGQIKRRPGAYTVALDRRTGILYRDYSGPPLPEKIYLESALEDSVVFYSDGTPQPRINCAEAKVGNQARGNGARVEDLDIFVIKGRPQSSTQPYERCDNCKTTVAGANVLSDCK